MPATNHDPTIPEFPIPPELEGWGIEGLSDEVIVERTAVAITEMLEWRGFVEPESPKAREVVALTLGILIGDTYFKDTGPQMAPLSVDDEAFVREAKVRIGKLTSEVSRG